MAHLDLAGIGYDLPDGRGLLADVSLRAGEGDRVALIGPNGAGKTTLVRIATGQLEPHRGTVSRSGTLAVMDQLVGRTADDRTVRDLLVAHAPDRLREVAHRLEAAELAMMTDDDEPAQLAYAQALADWAEVDGYAAEAEWDEITMEVLAQPFDRAQWRAVRTLSGGEAKRLALTALLRGPAGLLVLDEPDNSLDVPTKRWLEDQLRATTKGVLFVSHDRELLARTATHVAALEPGPAGATSWVHGGSFATFPAARAERMSRLEELRRRWDEEHAKLRQLVVMYRQKAAYNSDMAARLQAARTRLARFEAAGPPEVVVAAQHVTMRLRGGRTGKRAIVCTALELPGLTTPFDLEVWFGERVAVLGANGTGKSHLLRLLARGGSDPGPEHLPADGQPVADVPHTGEARLGARVRPGWFAQGQLRADLTGRTLLEVLHRGAGTRAGMGREQAGRALDRYELAHAAEQRVETLSGGQQARFQILLLELSGATLLLLDEPTDNLDLHSAEALEAGLDAFEGTVVAVTHDRWFTRGFDRFLQVRADGTVVETSEPVWEDDGVRRR
ncbi:ABC-F family ATP-binding cassette domain-containing protein [Georgenia yuyongxinii]|uniref:ABC-F family ATP-binding cassette domain-containing protein n=1 Tax=Georgenia yuyongxinii TaxID=2589797 RepID=A0A5B8C8P1_9MICO|nr:ATP-binding cassette domain-containing protein [Georgenia yuyongxinii]QDC25851.1 ABC-F family ATP-binding cassette domain-containing protein [Georgenia yuyongxinii]